MVLKKYNPSITFYSMVSNRARYSLRTRADLWWMPSPFRNPMRPPFVAKIKFYFPMANGRVAGRGDKFRRVERPAPVPRETLAYFA